MTVRVILTCGVILLVGSLFWHMGEARAQTTGGEADATSRQAPPWQFRCVPLVGKDEYFKIVDGKAWIHSIVYATASEAGTVPSAIAFELRTDPKEFLSRIAKVFTVGSAGPGQIDLDILVTNGLWIRGSGCFTILYKPLD